MSVAELVKSVSIDNMLRQREAIYERLVRARLILLEADEVSTAANLGTLSDFFPGGRDRIGRFDLEPFLAPGGPESCIRELDRRGWAYLLNESGLITFMNAAKRKEFDEQIRGNNCPEFTRENIEATFSNLYETRGEMFEDGVIALFRSLSWNYKTNSPVGFSEKFVMTYFLDGQYTGKNPLVWLNHTAANRLDDLIRVCCLIDGRPEPDHRDGIYHTFATPVRERGAPGEFENEWFRVKWFKNGNGHLFFKRMDVIAKLNQILAKRYPGAIPRPAQPKTRRQSSRHQQQGQAA